MKKFNLLLVAFFGFVAISSAQIEPIFGVKGGVSFTNLTADKDANGGNFGGLDSPDTKIGFHAGLAADVKIAELFGIGGELLYSQQGTKTEGTLPVIKTPYSNTFQLDYLSIPVLAKVYPFEGVNVYAGIQPSILLTAKQKNKLGDKETSVDLKKENNDFAVMNNTDISIPLGVGYRANESFSFDARYNLGTSAVFKANKDNQDFASKNRAIQVSVGYSF